MKIAILTAFASLLMINVLFAQCGTVTPAGNQTDYGNAQWYGYVYDGINNFTDYQGYITQSTTFDYSFNGDNNPFTTTGGCSVDANTFTVRFKMQLNIPCGTYQFTAGGDDGYRLSIDGGSTYLIDKFYDQGYATTSVSAYITAATTYLVLDYYENGQANQVSFSYVKTANGDGGVIGSDQSICFASTGDPAAFTSTSSAVFCSGNAFTYQWQSSPDNATWSDIASANADTYDPPAGFTAGTVYYRRKATDNVNSDIIYSNTVYVLGQTQQGDQTTYGSGSTPWIGYLYDGVNTFTSSAYLGYITESTAANFDESFTCGGCTISTNGCNLYTDTFSARFKSQQTVACGYYQFAISADDGIRLSIDGGSTYLINDYSDHAYRTATANAYLTAGTYNFIVEYYENTGGNRATFSMSYLADGYGGQIGSDQNLCGSVVDPAAFTNIASAAFCTGTVSYQWQESTDNSAFTDITSATSATYDIPSGASTGTKYYRRQATNGTLTFYSNTATVISEVAPGDQTTYGTNSWIGYVYDGVNNYTTANYQGTMTESDIFDETFCGGNCTQVISGCDFNTETFTIRYKMRITLANAGYTFTIGADDGVRLSIDGGSTYLLDDYSNHGYRTVSSSVVNLNGTYDFILEYYEDGGGNEVSFSYSAGPLPVSLSEFKGEAYDDYTLLLWTTESEQNNEGFYVERSLDGSKFESIGWVAGNGNSLIKRSYSFIDDQPQTGRNYYRLNQKDFDGKQEYSKVISIDFTGTSGFKLYPNPSQGNVTIDYPLIGNQQPYLKITDSKGNNVQFSTKVTEGKITVSGLSPGFYIASIAVGERTTRKKFIILN